MTIQPPNSNYLPQPFLPSFMFGSLFVCLLLLLSLFSQLKPWQKLAASTPIEGLKEKEGTADWVHALKQEAGM